MTRVKSTGRVIALAALAAATTALGACSAGQITQTAYMAPAVPGVNQSFTVTSTDPTQQGGSISLRDLAVVYDTNKGYAKGGSAQLQVGIFNDTPQPLKVAVTAPGAASSVTVGSAGASAQPSKSPSASPSATGSASPSAKVSGSASPSATATPSPSESSAAASGPATFTIPSGSYLSFGQGEGQALTLQGLTEALKPGDLVRSVNFQFTVGSNLQLTQAPASPAPETNPELRPRESCVFADNQAICRVPLSNPLSPQPRTSPEVKQEHE
ncbi:MAG: hypothetical protein HOU81_03150 [Hamadaea sp.]|uniref:hypothetical protein n=1 Tax=Hamadaea sp. TaxID=2024425 RepID=UPI001856D0D7|nr:hypothetical protein [Hamadaea sp.]NUR69792.1 hypothetical protein [Hamadaea sp.]NUT17558.1 hypothetical protein [Hamadaea sp.]